jgi:predicted secreted hydrolase
MGNWDFNFPEDHAMHPDARIEWWHYVGNVKSETGERFGFQVTFFRKKVVGRHAFIVHMAISDINGKRYLFAEKKTRHATVIDTPFSVCAKGCFMSVGERGYTRLLAECDNFSFDLGLLSLGDPVHHSKKGYYSLTDIRATGEIRINDRIFEVDGSAWMDHEFFTAWMDPKIVGWDWFGLRLSDDAQLMIYKLRFKNGAHHPTSSGTLVQNGCGTHLPNGSVIVKSIFNKGIYPAAWNISVPAHQIDLLVSPNLPGQECRSSFLDSNYQEASVSVSGTHSGQGYAELTGYDKPFRAISKRQNLTHYFIVGKKMLSNLGRIGKYVHPNREAI